MTKIADFFRPLAETFVDPRLREWKALLESGVTGVLEVNYWPNYMQDEPTMELRFNGHPPEKLPWDDDLNNGLVKLRVPAADARQEGERFSFGLRAAFSKAQRDFGDGYFNSVLFDFIRGSDFDQNEVIAVLLKNNSVVPVDRQTDKYARCHEMIDAAIRGRALELKDDLSYSMDEAWGILLGALARYLDRRFSVTIRRQRGLL